MFEAIGLFVLGLVLLALGAPPSSRAPRGWRSAWACRRSSPACCWWPSAPPCRTWRSMRGRCSPATRLLRSPTRLAPPPPTSTCPSVPPHLRHHFLFPLLPSHSYTVLFE